MTALRPSKSRLRRWIPLAGAFTLTTADAPPARAQPGEQESPADPAPRVRLVWMRDEGSRSCAAQAEVERRVQSRLGWDPFDADGERVVDARVESQDGAYHVELTLRSRDGDTLGERTFTSDEAACEALTGAAVLSIALLIDPDAELAPPSAEPAPAPPAPPSTPKPVPWAPVLIPIPAMFPPPPPPPAPPPPEPEPRFGLASSLDATLLAGWLPRAAVGLGGRALLQPGVDRLFLMTAVHHTPLVETDDGDFAFGMTGLDAGVCYHALEHRGVGLGPCGGFGLAAMTAISKRLAPVDPGEQPLVSGWLGGRLSAAAGPVFVAGEGALAAAFLRPSYRIRGSDETAFEPSVAAGRFAIGFGVRTP